MLAGYVLRNVVETLVGRDQSLVHYSVSLAGIVCLERPWADLNPNLHGTCFRVAEDSVLSEMPQPGYRRREPNQFETAERSLRLGVPSRSCR